MTRKSIGIALGILGLLAAIAASASALRPVANVWGQECGSVLFPEDVLPLIELTRALEEAAFETACPEAWAPLISWAVGFAAAAAVLIGMAAYLYFVARKNPSRGRPVPPKRQLSEELERVQNLYKSGGLTEEEYAAAKSRLLGDKGA